MAWFAVGSIDWDIACADMIRKQASLPTSMPGGLMGWIIGAYGSFRKKSSGIFNIPLDISTNNWYSHLAVEALSRHLVGHREV